MSNDSTTNTMCLAVEDLCDLLQVSRPTAYNLVHTEGFPVIRLGRRLLIPRAGLERWLDEHTDTVA